MTVPTEQVRDEFKSGERPSPARMSRGTGEAIGAELAAKSLNPLAPPQLVTLVMLGVCIVHGRMGLPCMTIYSKNSQNIDSW